MNFISILLLILTSGCTKMVAIPDVAGGSQAMPHSAPYAVSIKIKINETNEDVHYCGGAILNRHWILTAAHCVPSDKVVSKFTIYAGCHDVRGKERTVQKRHADYYVKHELFVGGISPYDIALIYTKEPFKWNKSVKAINLPKEGSIPTGFATLFGWGSTSTTLVPSFPKKLQTCVVPILDFSLCERILGGPNRSPLHKTNICTGPLSGGVSVCTSDSGGPLVQRSTKNRGAVEIIGIVSWGRVPCGQPNSPSIYTQVSYFIDWIEKQMSNRYR